MNGAPFFLGTMIYSVYHLRCGMNARPRLAQPHTRRRRVVERDDLCALLDHLGRLLAQEYVALLKPAGSEDEAKEDHE